MLRRDYLNPKCPSCSHGLTGLFSGISKIICPECGTVVVQTQANVQVSRWRFFLLAIVGLLFIPLLTTYLCWLTYVDVQLYDTENIFAILLTGAMAYLAISLVYFLKNRRRFRKHLIGSYRTPFGWVIDLVLFCSWTFSATVFAISMGFWAWLF